MNGKAEEPSDQIKFDWYAKDSIRLGPFDSYTLKVNPRHLGIQLARYKFCAKMLAGKERVLEIGCGGTLGLTIVAETVGFVYGIDSDPRLIEDNVERITYIKNCSFSLLDITESPPEESFDAAYALDVIEHIRPELENNFMTNICKSLGSNGVCIIGTPNIEARKYASPINKQVHVNLKNHSDLQALLSRYFYNGFLFSMNDEVVHTGFYPMAHYFLAVGVGVRALKGGRVNEKGTIFCNATFCPAIKWGRQNRPPYYPNSLFVGL